ncbi:hypothetical protein BJX64DRAFT_284504 [Aspergillus heterothallicus]
MPKLALPSSPPSTTISSPFCVIRARHHVQPWSRSRAASSHVRPLAHAQTRHDLPFYQGASQSSPSSTHPIHRLSLPFNLSYSLTDQLNPNNDHKPPDERIIKLGKTLRILSPLLPTILTNPLPPHILSPSVTLHLFPSTHPHLPTVKGRTLYRAALWAVPVAWSSVPFVGNVKLQILSERIVRAGTILDGHMHGAAQDPTGKTNGDCGGDERLVVRWRTERPSPSSSSPSSSSTTAQSTSTPPSSSSSSDATSSAVKESKAGTNKGLSVLLGGDAPIFKLSSEDQFTGLFIFSFDEEGRVLTQTIEHAEDASGWERTAKFVTLTDWLIGKARGSLEPAPPPGLVGCSGNGLSTRIEERDRDYWRGPTGLNG